MNTSQYPSQKPLPSLARSLQRKLASSHHISLSPSPARSLQRNQIWSLFQAKPAAFFKAQLEAFKEAKPKAIMVFLMASDLASLKASG
jgi:hypothetical protein